MARMPKTTSGPPVGRIVQLLRRNGVQKGIFGGSRGWAAVAVGTWGYTTLKKMARRESELVLREELKPGDRLIISNDRPTLESYDRRQRS
jgi:hypothetical protein